MKRCGGCKIEKTLDDYNWANKAAGKKQGTCRACQSAANKRYNENNSEKRRETWRRYRRDSYMLRKYNLTDEDYWRMYEEQGQVCAICGRPDPTIHSVQERPLHIDHHHGTGAVRALLCRGCNMGIGCLGDDPARVRAAAQYLERHGSGEG